MVVADRAAGGDELLRRGGLRCGGIKHQVKGRIYKR